MSTPDVQEAAERLRSGKCLLFDSSDPEKHDWKTLADAWLEEHPADDRCEFSLEWGQEVAGGQIVLADCDVLELQVGKQISVDEHRMLYIGHHDYGSVPTRGHFRRLCSVLGVPLK